MMRSYAEGDSCRRHHLLSYFGEEYESQRCGMCDNDVPRDTNRWIAVNRDEELPAAEQAPFAVGERVAHIAWGEGVVQRVDADSLTVLFDAAGYKTLATATVQERALLTPIGS